MPVEPLHVDLIGGRSVELTPAAKGFPDVVRLLFNDGLSGKRVLSDFKITAPTASRVLERELNLGLSEFNIVSSHYLEWSEAMLKVLLEEGSAVAAPKVTPNYNVKQRMITQPRSEALIYDSVNSAGGILSILKKKIEKPDTVIEWDKESLPYLACLDLDFHDPEAVEKPNDDELDRLGYALSPAPVCWWRSQGSGLKAIYAATPNDLFTAEELAVGAAAQLLTTVSVLRGKGSIELATRTRHPGAEQKGKRCGPLVASIPNDNFDVLARFSRAEATDAEIAEIIESEGFELGARLDHSYCLIDPQHVSNGTPIHVGPEGLYCHSCAGRLGHGMMSWGWIRKRHGYSNENEKSLAPIRKAFEQMVHVEHVDYLFASLFPALPENFRRILYRAQLKKTHGADARVDLAFKPFFFVRGLDCWLHADTLLTVGKPLAAADVGVLPSCVRYNEDEGTFHPVQSSISVHTNNGRVPGWVPILPYQFEPIFFVNNEAAENPDRIRCFPKRRTTRDRVSYVPQKNRMPAERAEQLISEHFPGINIKYVKALIIAAGCAESGTGAIPMLWATGPTEAAKTTTIRVVGEMYGESFQNLSGVKEDRLDQLFGEAMSKTRLLVFDDFAKVPADYQRLHTFIIRLNRGGHTYHAMYVGGTTPPMDNAVILTDWRIPAFFSQDPQFGRRVHLLRLENRIPIGWDKLGRMAEDWWKTSPELTQAANALHSWIVDEYFPPGDKESFAVKMERLGVPKLEDEAMAGDTQDAVRELVVQLIRDIAEAKELDSSTQKRVGRGARFIDWKGTNIGRTCSMLIDSMGKGVSMREPERTYNIENLKHVLDPFQLHMSKMFEFSDGISSIEFDLKAWGETAYVRLIESGRSTKSKSRKVNGELFKQWPPLLIGEAEAPVVIPGDPVPLLNPAEQPTEVVATLQHVADGLTHGTVEQTLAKLENDDNELVVITGEGPLIAYLDFESQSACNLKKHGSYVYAQHPSTRVMCAAIRVDGRKIFWTLDKYNLQMPKGVEYEHGRQFLLDMVMDPAGLIIVAHNTGFERPMWVYNLGLPEPLEWRDTMDKTLSLGLPAGADEAGQAILGMGKDLEGQAFIRKIWGPNKRGDLPPLTDAVLQRIIGYNFRDTDISYGIAQKYGLDMEPAWEQRVCTLHHDINHFGIHIDKDFAKALREFDSEFKEAAGQRVEEITGGAITRADLTRNDFLREQLNLNLPPDWQLTDMRQTSLEAILDEFEEDPDQFDPVAIEVIKCRLVVTRAALAKVEKALDTISKDGRAKAQLRYHGAATGRWSGYQIQPQNMKRPNEDLDLPAAIAAIERRDKAAFLALCKDKDGKTLPPYELLGSLVRGVLTPAPGHTFVVGDFASVEARAVLWLAGDEEGLAEYRRKDAADEAHPKGKDPTVPDSYQNLAGFLFNKDPVTVSKKERGGGKIGILACGFGGGPNAVDRMAIPAGVDLAAVGKSSQDVVDAYRGKYPKVRAFWYECERAFKTVLMSRRTTVQKVGRIIFKKLDDRVQIILPSGRPINYMNARIDSDPYSKDYGSIIYDNAVRGKTIKRKTYGGKIVENIVQAFCRDLLANVMLQCADAGAAIPFHVHDEVILEMLTEVAPAWRDWLKTVMRTPPDWAKGMPVFSLPELMVRYGK